MHGRYGPHTRQRFPLLTWKLRVAVRGPRRYSTRIRLVSLALCSAAAGFPSSNSEDVVPGWASGFASLAPVADFKVQLRLRCGLAVCVCSAK